MANNTKGTKKKAAPKTKKSTTRAPEKESASASPPLRREIAGFVFLLLAVVVIAGFFTKEETLIDRICGVMWGLFGIAYYILIPAFLIAAWILIFHHGRPVTFRLISALLLPVLFANIVSLLIPLSNVRYSSASEYLALVYGAGQAKQTGGVFGALSLLFYKIGFPGFITTIFFIVMFVLFAVKAIDYDLLASFKRVKERASVPYNPEDYEQEEPVAAGDVRTQSALEVRRRADASRRAALVLRLHARISVGEHRDSAHGVDVEIGCLDGAGVGKRRHAEVGPSASGEGVLPEKRRRRDVERLLVGHEQVLGLEDEFVVHVSRVLQTDHDEARMRHRRRCGRIVRPDGLSAGKRFREGGNGQQATQHQ